MAGVIGLVKLLFGLLFVITYSYVFITSSLVLSLLCVVLTAILWPCSKTTYRKIVCVIGYSVFGQMVWVCKDWAAMDVVLFGENDEVFQKFGKESGLVTLSHRGDLDWVAGFIVGAYYNFLHAIRSLPKRSVKFVPGFGFIIWALEYPFLKRNYASDQKTIAKYSDAYNEYPYPIQVAIFCEGTRFTVEKHKKALEYAREKNLPELQHHLVPRTKGFAVLVEHLRIGGKFTGLYDVGFAYRNWPGKHLPSFLDILLGRKVELLWYMRRFSFDILPEGHEELQRFCYGLFEHKDKVYEYFLQNGTFPGVQPKELPFKKTLWLLRLNQLFWTTITCGIPSVALVCTLTWHNLALVCAGGCLFNTVVLLAMLKYAYGGAIPTDMPNQDGATPTDTPNQGGQNTSNQTPTSELSDKKND